MVVYFIILRTEKKTKNIKNLVNNKIYEEIFIYVGDNLQLLFS